MQLGSLRFLLRQGMAVRGHDEIEGNLRQLMLLQAKGKWDPVTAWVNRGTYLSHDVVNELISDIGQAIARKVIDDVRAAGKYALLVDETRDVSNSEQLTVILRWVDESFEIHEDFVGFMSMEKVDAASLTEAIKDVLVRCVLPLSDFRGQGYDATTGLVR